MTTLETYKEKRNFNNTPETKADLSKKTEFKFVVQKHEATRLHFDFRLQLDGVLKSWAVPKGPSLRAGIKRLAMQVEDHPVSYINFEGTIPEGKYGAGTVKIYDKGDYQPVDEEGNAIDEKQALKNLNSGELKIEMHGKKIKGGYVLVRMKKDEKNWLLIKHKRKISE